MNTKTRRVRRAPPSERARSELAHLLSAGAGRNENLVSQFAKAATRAVVQQLLEAEQAEFLGDRGRYARRADTRGSRNGYEPLRLRTEEGEIKISVPQVRNLGKPYRSRFVRHIADDSDALERTLLDAYEWSLSPQDAGRAFKDAKGVALISASAASEVIGQISSDLKSFFDRDLSEVAIEHVFCDVVLESSKRQGDNRALLVVWAIDGIGKKHLLHLTVGDKTSEAAWETLLRDVIDRNSRTPKTVTTNGAAGTIEAVETVFPKSVRLRHWFDRPTERTKGIE